MSSSFFEVFEKGYVFEAAPPPEIRLYYNEEGVISDKKYVDKNIQEDKTYIVITQEQYDSINYDRHRVVDRELVWISPNRIHWYLNQEELERNPYTCKLQQTSKGE